ncbi:uncharacterized protein LOC129590962 [Paramacrobiotus metropolitanus]|uniref:uncharacterized protein LOC129590962 n=1 Tax=Paramacrobiotus metropolitanus TaxID=2943436 RepID=UPI002445C20D|nr:uncharacterized protein LOC129590962 [Paramacrobiotus metropolitanus]
MSTFRFFATITLICSLFLAGIVHSVYVAEPKKFSVIMEPGESLSINARSDKPADKYSPNSGYRFALESGRLAVYDQCSGKPTFATFNDSSTTVSRLELDATNGQLIMTGSHGSRRNAVLWSSGSSPAITDYSDAELRLTDNGFLELCARAKARCYWQSSGVRVRTCENDYGNASQVVLRVGESLKVGDTVESANGEYKARLQPDGNFLVLRKCDETPVFSSYSYPGTAGNVTLERNGSLVVYGTVYVSTDRALWFAEPWKVGRKYGNSQLVLDNNGLMYLCQKGGECYWQSGFLLYYDHCDQVQQEEGGESHLPGGGEGEGVPMPQHQRGGGQRIFAGFFVHLGLVLFSIVFWL